MAEQLGGLERRRVADHVLGRALERDAAGRVAFVRRECAGDDELERFVLQLCEFAAATDADLVGPAGALVPAGRLALELAERTEAEAEMSVGTAVGCYRVVREIGRGGMGVVYLAERCDGHFDQRVALKLIPRGAETREAVARFERERQILATLVHPNIAHLVDGGISAAGVPYFAMEHVEGQRIDEYCDERRLSIDDRLRLFRIAAGAVDFANSRLVVHRDIKPTNLLVTSTGQIKLLDFGIAKLVAADPVDATRTSTRAMTPEYASPEQMLGEPITVASDVYQLGLLLYELLTGCPAHSPAHPTPAKLEDAVCRDASRRPSAQWSAGDAERRAGARSTTPAAARRQLCGDLDNIVMKSLRKDPERRYRSAGHLIDDIERFTKRQPVLAQPDRWSYRTRKFLSRHRAGAIAVAGLVALLLAYVVTLTIHSRRLEEERDRTRLEARKATEVKDFLLQLFTADNPSLAKRPRPTATDVLEEGARSIRTNPSLDPLVRAELLSTMGETFRKLDRYDEARAAFSDAGALRAAHLPAGHPDHTLVDFERGLMAWELGRQEAAQRLFESVIERRRRALDGVDDRLTVRTSGLLATTLYAQGDYASAIAKMRDAIERRGAVEGGGLPYPQRQWANLGYMLSGYGDLAAGEAALRHAIDLARAEDQPPSPISGPYANLAETLRMAGRYGEARRAIDRAIAFRSEFVPHANSARTALLLRRAEILVDGGWRADAVAEIAALDEALRSVDGVADRYAIRISRLRGRLAMLGGDSATAERLLREVIAAGSPPRGRASRSFARDCLDLGRLLLDRGSREAAGWLRRADDLLRAHTLPTHPDRVLAVRLLGDLNRFEGERGGAAAR